MEYVLLGWPAEGATLQLDHREFPYAGKFVMSTTGKAIVRDGEILAAAAFNEDRTDDDTLWIRYVSVREDRQGDGLGARLAAFVANHADSKGYGRVRIAVNNPFSYHALYKAGFAYTGRQTGLAELVLERPGDRDHTVYQSGLEVFSERDDLADVEREFLAAKRDCDPPSVIEPPTR